VKEFTQFENYRVEIWRRPYQRSMHLRVRPEGHLRVTCGRRTSQREIGHFINESREFILKQVLRLEQLKRQHPPKQLLSGDEFLFFGQTLRLELVWTWMERIKVEAFADKLEMLAPLASSGEERRKAMHKFYRIQAQLHLRERLEFFAARMGRRFSALSIRGQNTRWGSCTSEGKISLNWKLLACPEEVIDYVVIHELAHLSHMDHSPRFWAVVAEHHGGWRAAKRWLKEHEFQIGVQFRAPHPSDT
jgi:predicted metal-dependent hydrolase